MKKGVARCRHLPAVRRRPASASNLAHSVAVSSIATADCLSTMPLVASEHDRADLPIRTLVWFGSGPRDFCSCTLKVPRSAVGSGSGRPEPARPMSQLGRTIPLRGQGAKVRNRRISPVAAHSGDRLLSEPIAGTQPWLREMVFMPQAGPPEQFDGSAGTAEMPSIMVYGHTCTENSRFPAACESELSEGTAACS
jgi:hypothetical protein